jgi:hypothetical protein
VLISGHVGEAGQPRAASYPARSPASTAVSSPPKWQPQQSARVSTHWASTEQRFAGTAQVHDRQPVVSSIA